MSLKEQNVNKALLHAMTVGHLDDHILALEEAACESSYTLKYLRQENYLDGEAIDEAVVEYAATMADLHRAQAVFNEKMGIAA